jgi:cell wall-associated NlpC family hydrolase
MPRVDCSVALVGGCQGSEFRARLRAGRRRPARRPALLVAATAPAACAALLVTGASVAGESPAVAGATSPSVAGENAAFAGATSPSVAGYRLATRARHPIAAGDPLVRSRSLARFEHDLGLIDLASAAAADAVARRARHPSSAADAVRRLLVAMTAAGDRIARLPYLYGGGHGSFSAAGYDCSGSVSYVLHAAGLLAVPADSSGLEGFGEPGPGRHVTIYANAGHALMTVDRRRFDTIAFQETGTRWSSSLGSVAGYAERHPPGM